MSNPDYTDTHPRPSVAEALERSKMRHPASDGTQRSVWIAFFIGLALLLGFGLVWGLRQRHAEPAEAPTLGAPREAPTPAAP